MESRGISISIGLGYLHRRRFVTPLLRFYYRMILSFQYIVSPYPFHWRSQLEYPVLHKIPHFQLFRIVHAVAFVLACM